MRTSYRAILPSLTCSSNAFFAFSALSIRLRSATVSFCSSFSCAFFFSSSSSLFLFSCTSSIFSDILVTSCLLASFSSWILLMRSSLAATSSASCCLASSCLRLMSSCASEILLDCVGDVSEGRIASGVQGNEEKVVTEETYF